jgi:hypothetical protein
VPSIPSSINIARKASYAALTQGSLAGDAEAIEAYHHHLRLSALLTDRSASADNMPTTPGRPGTAASAEDAAGVGDIVDVPGGMYGTVRFVGTVGARKGTFAGVELNREFASRGKNSGDVDG